MGSISLSLPDKLLSSVTRLAEARELSPESWVREWVMVGIAQEVLPAEREDPAPSAPPAAGLADWNSVAELAEYLNVSSRHLYNLISSNSLGHVKVGTLVRIRRDQVEAYLKENAKEAKGGQR
jgi:excisionase family DNA binding protein